MEAIRGLMGLGGTPRTETTPSQPTGSLGGQTVKPASPEKIEYRAGVGARPGFHLPESVGIQHMAVVLEKQKTFADGSTQIKQKVIGMGSKPGSEDPASYPSKAFESVSKEQYSDLKKRMTKDVNTELERPAVPRGLNYLFGAGNCHDMAHRNLGESGIRYPKSAEENNIKNQSFRHQPPEVVKQQEEYARDLLKKGWGDF